MANKETPGQREAHLLQASSQYVNGKISQEQYQRVNRPMMREFRDAVVPFTKRGGRIVSTRRQTR